MRKILLASILSASVCVAAQAQDPYENDPQARVYAGFSFGGPQSTNRTVANSFRYGLKLDYSHRLTEKHDLPSLMQFDFDRHGLTETRVNGLSAVRRVMLNQDEGGEASAEGASTEYSMMDWGLIAVGVVGIGFVAAEALGSDDEEGGAASGGGGGGGEETGGDSVLGISDETGLPLCDPLLDLGCL